MAALPSPTHLAEYPASSAGAATTYPRCGTIVAGDGRRITRGAVEIADDGERWSAVVRRLDAPGIVASAYFAGGVRNVVLVLDDGRRARARIAGTSFVAGNERVCRLTGLEPFALSA